MTVWDFRVMLNREPDTDEFNRLFEAGLDDCALVGGTQPYFMCDREGGTLLDAIASVLVQIRKIEGLWAIGIGHDDGVTLGDAARRHGGRTQASLRQLSSGQRGPGGFPEPVMATDNINIYSWAEVSDWLRVKMGDDIPRVPRDIALADAAVKLACRARAAHQETQVLRLVDVA
jgi:hypothetical protein